MSGDVQPRKRNKDNKKKKKGSFESQRSFDEKDLLRQKISWCSFDDDLDFDDTNIHIQKDIKFGGNVFAKVFFSLVFGALICMVGLIVLEHRGSSEVQTDSESPWSLILDGWLEDHKDEHDAHDHHAAHHDDDEEEAHELEDHDEEHDDEDHDHDEDGHDEEDHDEHEDDHEEEHDDHGEEDHEVEDSLEEEQGIFAGFIKKYIYNTDASLSSDDQDEGYETSQNEEEDVEETEEVEENETEQSNEENDEEEEEKNDEEDVEDEIDNYKNKKTFNKVTYRSIKKESLEDEDEEEEKEKENDVDEDDDIDERVVDDWRKIVYKSPSPKDDSYDDDVADADDDTDDDKYRSPSPIEEDEKDDVEEVEKDNDDDDDDEKYRSPSPQDDDNDVDNADESEQGDDADEEDTPEENEDEASPQVDEEGDEESKPEEGGEEDEAGKIPIPQGPLPPSTPSPVYVEEISPVEEEPIIPMDRRATLVEPGEVVAPPSDAEESDLGEYEEEEEVEEEEEEISQTSDIEPTRDSTIITYEYSPAESEQEVEEEEEVSETSAPINDKWATVSGAVDSQTEDEEMLGESGSEIEYSDNEPTTTPAPVVQSKFGGPKNIEDEFLFEDFTNDQDWEIHEQLDNAEVQYNESENSI